MDTGSEPESRVVKLSRLLKEAVSQQAIEDARQRVQQGLCLLKRLGNPKRIEAITFRHLGKLWPISRLHLQDLRLCFAPLISGEVNEGVTVLGLSESGIVPSYAVHTLMHGNAHWFCTSRDATPNATSFQEAHSHAPTHYLPERFCHGAPGELWIVEDEITTGKTLLNLLESLPRGFRGSTVRVLALLDARGPADRVAFEQAVGAMLSANRFAELQCHSVFQLPAETLRESSRTSALAMPASEAEPTLVAGEAIREALSWLDADPRRSLQHVSLSPWELDEVHIQRVDPIGSHYLYNWMGTKSPVQATWFSGQPDRELSSSTI